MGSKLLKPIAIILKGPTASGKTALAVELVRRLPLEIVSVDSALVYRGMDIGTAKPDDEILSQAPHRLIDICEPVEAYSAARFRQDALREMADIVAGGRIPLLVGGTMLYFRALEQGLSELPEADVTVRQELERELECHGLVALHEKLQRIDPVAAARIHPNDPQRIIRALEVYEISGRPLTDWLAEQNPAEPLYHFIRLALMPSDRSLLHDRIGERFQQMLEQGFVAEVEGLRQRPSMHGELPSMRSVGYRQVWQYLEGKIDYEQMVHDGIVASRRLAKRQLTWLRGEPDLMSFDPFEPKLTNQVLNYLDQIPILS